MFIWAQSSFLCDFQTLEQSVMYVCDVLTKLAENRAVFKLKSFKLTYTDTLINIQLVLIINTNRATSTSLQ